MKRTISAICSILLAGNLIAGTHIIKLHKGWNFLGAKTDMIVDELVTNSEGNITEILAYENGKWVNWKAGAKNNELNVLLAGTGFLVNSKNDLEVEITSVNDKLVSYSNGKVIFKVPLERVKNLYIDDQIVTEENPDIKIDKKEIENFTVLISSESGLEGVRNFTIETVDGTKISKDIEINFKNDKMIRGWSFSTSYGYCGSKTNWISKYASDWAVDIFKSGRGDVYLGEACRKHDECYENQLGKSYCDRKFYYDMKDACWSNFDYNPKTWREKASLRACLYKAWAYYKAVALKGYDAYKNAAK